MNATVQILMTAVLGAMMLSPLNACSGRGKAHSLAAYDQLISESKRCDAEAQCTVAGGVKGCRCASPVRSDAKARVDAAAQGAVCPAVERLYCPPLKQPRCEAGVCVATPASRPGQTDQPQTPITTR